MTNLFPAVDVAASFKRLHYHLYTNSNLPRAERLSAELMRLLFCKIYDELHTSGRFVPHDSNSKTASEIRHLFDHVKVDYADIFDSRETLSLDDESIAFAVEHLHGLSLLRTEADVVGTAFETLIGPALRGEKGQFFTPRSVVNMCVEMLDPSPDERIIDPACGSGGFLTVALRHLLAKEGVDKMPLRNAMEDTPDAEARGIFGIDRELDLVRLTRAHLAMLGDIHAPIFCEDSLAPPSSWSLDQQRIIELGSYDVVLTNPPFGSRIPITSPATLGQYELGKKWKKATPTTWNQTGTLLTGQVPQTLFIERCLQLLRTGGRMAIVLPDGVFGNPSDRYILDFIQRNATVLAVVSCPHETFQPHTHTKTSVLFLENKRASGRSAVFMAIAEKVGHNKNGKTIFQMKPDGSMIRDQDGTPIVDNDLPHVARRYLELKGRSSLSKTHDSLGFTVRRTELKDNILIPDYYNPTVKEDLAKANAAGFEVVEIAQLIEDDLVLLSRGNEIGSQFYGLGSVPFVRTTDIVNWEIKIDPVKCVPEEVYEEYAAKQDVQVGDIFFVNDGTFLIGRSAMVTPLDTKIVFQSHLKKLRAADPDRLDAYLLFYMLNTRLVREQVLAKTFIQATISTLGNRLAEICLPVPRSASVRARWSDEMRRLIEAKTELRRQAVSLIEL